jgi:hypothetical protein
MTIYLEGNAIAPNKVSQALDAYENPNDLARYTLRFNDIDHNVDVYGIIRDRGRFYGEHWIIVNAWYTVQDGSWGETVYDECDRAVTVIKLEPWESQTTNGVDHLIIGLYLTDDGFLGWYYTEDTDQTVESFAASIQATTDYSDPDSLLPLI